jgi:hypothetical protein
VNKSRRISSPRSRVTTRTLSTSRSGRATWSPRSRKIRRSRTASNRRALGTLFALLAAALAGVAFESAQGAGGAVGRWLVAVAAAAIAVWLAALAFRALK